MCVCSVFVSVPFESVAKIAPHVQYSKDLIQDEMTEINQSQSETGRPIDGRWFDFGDFAGGWRELLDAAGRLARGWPCM